MSTWRLQRVGRESPFSRLDFRPKFVGLIIVMILAFVWESPLMGGVLTLTIVIGCLAAGVRKQYIRLVVTLMLPFYGLLLLTHGFFNVEQVRALTGRSELTPLFTFPESWWLIGGGSLSREGLLYGLSACFKALTMALALPLVVFTTDVNNLIVGLVKMRVPYRFAFIFSSALRFFPLLFEEIQSIIEAQRLRGLAIEKMGPLKRVRVYAKVAVPLILGALIKSQMLEVVLQSKGFSASPERTYLHESILRRLDYAVIAVLVLMLTAAMVVYFWLGIGKFAGPV